MEGFLFNIYFNMISIYINITYKTLYIYTLKNSKSQLLNGPVRSAHSSTDKICSTQLVRFHCVFLSEGVFLDSLSGGLKPIGGLFYEGRDNITLHYQTTRSDC